MPKIPDPADIRRDIPGGAVPLPPMDTSGVGRDVDIYTKLVRDRQKKRNSLEVSSAEADFLTLKAEQDHAYDEIDDYKSIVPSYEEKMNEGLAAISSRITDPEQRAFFVDKYRPQIAIGVAAMGDLSWEKEKDDLRAGVQDRVNKMGDLAVTGDPYQAIEAVGKILNDAADNEIISEQERVDMMRQFGHESAVRRIEAATPQKRLGMLNEQWAKDNLRPEIYAKLKREAVKEGIGARAQVMVTNELINLSPTEAINRINNIKDVQLHDEVAKRYLYDLSARRAARDQENYDITQKYLKRFQESTWSDGPVEVDQEEFDKLPFADQQNIMKIVADDGKPPAITPGGLRVRLLSAIENKDHDEAVRLYNQMSSSMSAKDRSALEEFIAKGTVPPDTGLDLTNEQFAKAMYPKKGQIDKRNEFRLYLEKELSAYRSATGKDPDKPHEFRDRIAKEYERKVVVDSFMGITDEESIGTISADDFGKWIRLQRDENPDVLLETYRHFGDRKYTKAEFSSVFHRLMKTMGKSTEQNGVSIISDVNAAQSMAPSTDSGGVEVKKDLAGVRSKPSGQSLKDTWLYRTFFTDDTKEEKSSEKHYGLGPTPVPPGVYLKSDHFGGNPSKLEEQEILNSMREANPEAYIQAEENIRDTGFYTTYRHMVEFERLNPPVPEKVSEIPKEVLRKIRKILGDAGNHEPSDYMIMRTYIELTNAAK